MISVCTKYRNRLSKEIISLAKKKYVLDIGTRKRFNKNLSLYKHLFKNNYIALGYNPGNFGEDTCDINGDICALPFKNESVDGIICFDVLEHVMNPFKAMQELYRVLKRGGTLLLTVPFLNPYHGKSSKLSDFSHSEYPDFWRFTFQGIQKLSEEYSSSEIIPASNSYNYYISMLFGYKYTQSIRNVFERIKKETLNSATTHYLLIARK